MMIVTTQQMREYAALMRLDKPVGIFLLLWPTLWALWVAGEGHPDGWVLTVFVCGVILMRSAGCVINDVADRKIDKHVARTQDRPLTAGRVTKREALILFAILCLMAFGLVLTLSMMTIMMSLVAVMLAATYPFMKRYTYLPQVYLGAAFGWAIPMAFMAHSGAVPKVAWLLFLANILWVTAYDTMYAMVDRADDLKIGVKSTAILFGGGDVMMVAMMQALVLLVLVNVGGQLEMGLFYYLGLGLAAGLAVYQIYLIKDRDEQRCFKAFLNNFWYGAAVFSGMVLHFMMQS